MVTLMAFLFLYGCEQESDMTKLSQLTTHFEKTNGTETATYHQVISFYQMLAKYSTQIKIIEMGSTDSGYPLHIVIWNPDKVFDIDLIKKDKSIMLINNGIHPGESDGIDATMMLFRDLVLRNKEITQKTVLVTIPVYNIGGALQRNSYTRTNQNGPKAYGFRGNARNYDLNRDFIKCDSKNAKSFTEIFQLLDPDVFVDTHVSNGADYQYVITHLFTQHNKLGGQLGAILNQTILPEFEDRLKALNWDSTPYVNVWGGTPDQGWEQFMDFPRYSTGYAALWHTLGLMIETHMLKTYKKRVEGTYHSLKVLLQLTDEKGPQIRKLRSASKILHQNATYPLRWVKDTTKVSKLSFKGYEGGLTKSEITGTNIVTYDRNKPYTKQIQYYNHFKPDHFVEVPKAYLIPKAWWRVIDLLQANLIEMQPLSKDSLIKVQMYKIESYQTKKAPYEGHYLHFNTKVTAQNEAVIFKKGDMLVYSNQKGFRYLLETLEPEASDSFFNWNYFDTVLQQKEGFSTYVWNEEATKLLKSDSMLRKKFNLKKEDTLFLNNPYAQLDWLHKQSKHYEKPHLRYPVFRILN